MSERVELTYDGKGINGPDEYRSRVATFHKDEDARKYGPLFAVSPELLTALKGLREELRAHVKMDVKKHYRLMVADAYAGSVIHKLESVS